MEESTEVRDAWLRSTIKPRVTSVWRQEGEAWKLVHAHFSVGVPDEEVVALQGRGAN